MAKADKSLVVKKGEGTPLWMMGSLYDIKATSEATGGALSAVEMTIPPGASSAPPPHRHNCMEAVYVVEGMIKYHIEERTVDAGPGSFLCFPKKTLEWMEATGSAPAKLLVIYTPGGMDKFFQEVAEPAKSRSLPPPPKSPPDFAMLAKAAKKHGLELVPPRGA